MRNLLADNRMHWLSGSIVKSIVLAVALIAGTYSSQGWTKCFVSQPLKTWVSPLKLDGKISVPDNIPIGSVIYKKSWNLDSATGNIACRFMSNSISEGYRIWNPLTPKPRSHWTGNISDVGMMENSPITPFETGVSGIAVVVAATFMGNNIYVPMSHQYTVPGDKLGQHSSDGERGTVTVYLVKTAGKIQPGTIIGDNLPSLKRIFFRDTASVTHYDLSFQGKVQVTR